MERSGREILVDVLTSEGVSHIFGNPGSTELPLMDELVLHPEINYVLALQENTAVAMADGYAQATGRPAFVNLHAAGGLGGGMGNLVNAVANRTPLVVTAGQQDRRQLVADPFLSGDLVGMARSVSKSQHEIRNLGELGIVLRRAFRDATSPPAGPVFVSIPIDVLDEVGAVPVPEPSDVHHATVPDGLEEMASLLAGVAPDQLAIVAGDGVANADALSELQSLAESLGSPVFSAPLYAKLAFPTTHPLWSGMLPHDAASLRAALSNFERVFVVGAQAFLLYPYTPGPAVPSTTELLHLDSEPARVARTHPVRLGLVGQIKATLAAMLPYVRASADADRAAAALNSAAHRRDEAWQRLNSLAMEHSGRTPMHPISCVQALLHALPPDGIVVDEAITTSFPLRQLYRADQAGSYYFCAAGVLGWGIPAALGIKLARPDRPVLCIVGDGSAMYTIQALWTAARHEIPVTVAVVNNRQYAILKAGLASTDRHSVTHGTFVGMDLDGPPIDYVGLAQSLGVEGLLVEKAGDVADATQAALESERPFLLELPIAAPDAS